MLAWHQCRDRRGLGHAPDLADRDPDRGEELEHLERAGRGADHVPLAAIEAEPLADLREHKLLGARVGTLKFLGDRLAGLFGAHLAQAEFDRLERPGALRLIRLRRNPGLERRLQLLPDARHASEERRVTVRDVREHLHRVRTASDCVTPRHLAVVAEAAIGDVCKRQVRDHHPARIRPGHLIDPATFRHLVGVSQLDALRRTGRARGVDQRQHIVGPDRAPALLEVESLTRVRALELVERDRVLGRGVEHDQVLDDPGLRDRLPRALEERRLDDHHAVGGVTDQKLDLLGRRCVVDRERRSAEMHHRGVEEVELGAVGEHEPNRVAAAHAERVKAAGEPPDAFRVLGERDHHAVADRAQRNLIEALRRGQLERLAHRACGQSGRRSLGALPDLDSTLQDGA